MGELLIAPSASLNRSAMSFKVMDMSFNSVVITSDFDPMLSGISRNKRIKNTTDMRRHSRRRVGRYSIINLATIAWLIYVLSITDLTPSSTIPNEQKTVILPFEKFEKVKTLTSAQTLCFFLKAPRMCVLNP